MQSSYIPRARSLAVALVLVLLGIILFAGSAHAQAPVSGTRNCNLPNSTVQGKGCTANDAGDLTLTVKVIEACQYPGDTAKIELLASFASNSATRYDMSLWISTDGDTNMLDLEANRQCFVSTLPLTPSPALTSCNDNPTGNYGPFWQLEGVNQADACGDVCPNKTVTYQTPFVVTGSTRTPDTVTITCVDLNGDGNVDDVAAVLAYDNNQVGTCTGYLTANPGTNSKCLTSLEPINVTVAPFQVDIEKSGPFDPATNLLLDPVDSGQTIYFYLDARNATPGTVTQRPINNTFVIQDKLDSNFIFQSAQVISSLHGGTCSHDGVNPGGTVTCQLTVSPSLVYARSDSFPVRIKITVQVNPDLNRIIKIPNTGVVNASWQNPDNTTIVLYSTDEDTIEVNVPVALAAFQAELKGSSLEFAWTTATEVGNVGFNLYAVEGDGRVKLNEHTIPATGVDTLERQNYSYSVADNGATTFYLEDVDLNGQVRRHGPFILGQRFGAEFIIDHIDWAAIAAESDAKAELREAQQVSQANRRLSSDAWIRGANADGGELAEQVGTIENVTSVFLPQAAMLNSFTGAGAAKFPAAGIIADLLVKTNGVYRLTFEQLATAGYDMAGVESSAIAVTHRGQPIHVRVVSQRFWGPGAFLEFYGEAVDTQYTDTNIYKLVVDPRLAKRAGLDQHPVTPSQQVPAFYMEEQVVDDDVRYGFISPSGDPWYALEMQSYQSPATYNVNVKVDDYVTGAANPTLDVVAYGGTAYALVDLDHHLRVRLNGTELADRLFDGRTVPNLKMELQPSHLKNGDNALELILPGDRGVDEIIRLDRYTVTYPRQFKARAGVLEFTANAAAFRVTNLPGNKVVIYRRVNGDLVRIEPASITAENGGYAVLFPGASGKTAQYIVYAESALLTPQLRSVPDWADIQSGKADLVIITHPDFADGLGALVQAREQQGYTVRVAKVDEVYRQFNHGIVDPSAIKAYIAHAMQNMGAKYFLLVGGDVYDYRNRTGYGAFSFIPTMYTATDDLVQFAPADPMYTDLQGDGVPDAAIGRLPVRNSQELAAVIAKTLAYNGQNRHALFTADENTGVVFSEDSDSFAQRLGTGWTISKAYVDSVGVSAARQQVLSIFKQGPALVSFVGHSDPVMWTQDGLFTSADVQNLGNFNKPTVVTQYGCWTNYYVSTLFNTLGHKFMLTDNQGAAAVLGASTMTNASTERELGDLVTELLDEPGMTIGEALHLAKQEIARTKPEAHDVLLGYNILGDPTLVVTK